jgi:hypothetical protein
MPRLSLLLALTIAATPALAQNPQPTSPTNPTVPIAPPNAPSPPPERIAPGPGSGTMSDHLSQQRGTISPPNVDPGMTVQPSGRATTPVIPPPGSPGGNQSVVPK